jgi:4-diphosphocytidyl-2-C-methyl-D-erythritol kinase
MLHSDWKCECLSPAKLNITLDVSQPDATGFHPLDSIAVKLNLSDEMAFAVRSGPRCVRLILKDKRPNAIAHPAIPRDERNLVVRAAQRLLDLKPDFDATLWVTLIKNIPSEAGLGAGSSNAAMTIKMFGDYLRIPTAEQHKIAGEIGSDVALFLHDTPIRMQHYGEVITPISLSGMLEGVVIRPASGMSTPLAYRTLDADAARFPGTTTADIVARGALTHECLSNDFEGVVRNLNPDVDRLFSTLKALGVLRVQLCGSGSAVFAVTETRADSVRIVKALSGDVPYMKLVSTQ